VTSRIFAELLYRFRDAPYPGVQAQIARLALRLPPLPSRDRSGSRLDVVQARLAVTLALARVVQMSYGDRRQTAPRRPIRSKSLVGLVDRGQQLEVGPPMVFLGKKRRRQTVGRTRPAAV
jgi:hypothetical protein